MNRLIALIDRQTRRRWRSEGFTSSIPPLMHLPVPWVFVLTYLIGVGIQALLPLSFSAGPLQPLCRIVGFITLAVGVALAAWSLNLFRAERTTTIPFEAAANLVTRGPYRFSRNPMYVSLTLIYLGEAGILAQGWPLILLPLVLLYLHRTVIPVEEAGLRKVFAEDYERYCVQVRRWI